MLVSSGLIQAETSPARIVSVAILLWRQSSDAICCRRGFLMREDLARFENPDSRRALVSSLGAGFALCPLLPKPLTIADECAQAFRTSFDFLSM